MGNDKLDPIAEIAAAVEKNRRGRDRDESRGRGGRYSTQTAAIGAEVDALIEMIDGYAGAA